jgi:hypothetical protein
MFTFRHRRQQSNETTDPLPFPTIPPPKRHWLFGLIVSLFGHILFYFGFFCFAATLAYALLLPVSYFIEPQIFHFYILTIPVVVPGLLALPFGAHVVIYGRRMRVKSALTVLSNDRRPHVLYLRSFDDDDLPDPTFRSPFHLQNLPNPFIPKRYEERLAPTLRRIGPVVSIGRPGERRSELGTARVYVNDDEWQTAIRYFAQNAGAVLIVIGRTHSLWWEIDFALANVQPERLLFFFPYADKPSERRKFWRKYYEIIPSVIPSSISERMETERQERYQLFRKRAEQDVFCSWPEDLGDAQFIDFLDAATPRLLPTKRPVEAIFYSIIFPKSVRSWISIHKTLRPFIKKVRNLNIQR